MNPSKALYLLLCFLFLASPSDFLRVSVFLLALAICSFMPSTFSFWALNISITVILNSLFNNFKIRIIAGFGSDAYFVSLDCVFSCLTFCWKLDVIYWVIGTKVNSMRFYIHLTDLSYYSLYSPVSPDFAASVCPAISLPLKGQEKLIFSLLSFISCCKYVSDNFQLLYMSELKLEVSQPSYWSSLFSCSTQVCE